MNEKYKGFRCSPPTRQRKSKIKDTKRWCRGKEGVEHVKEWKPKSPTGKWYDLICVNCGKKFEYCWSSFTMRQCKCGHHN